MDSQAIGYLAFGSVPTLGAAWLAARRYGRLQYYQRLARQQTVFAQQFPPEFLSPDPESAARQFQADALARVDRAFSPRTLAALAEECAANQSRAQRSYVPAHKKGGTLSYENVHLHAPRALALYHSPVVRAWLSRVVGEEVRPTANHDQSSCSILYYDRAGDHIHWHFDHNFYPGRHFTVLVSVVNRSPAGGVSSGWLERRGPAGEVIRVATDEGSLVVFEGKRVRHRASPVGERETRIMLSMTFCTDPRIGWGWEMLRRVKDMAYFGPRVLWE